MLRPAWWGPWRAAGIAAAVAMWGAQVAVPLLPVGRRAVPTNLVVVFLTLAAGSFVAAVAGPGRAVAGVGVAAALGLGVEVIGTRTGLPFGEYAYTDRLQPQVLGVPVAVALAWAAMGIPAWAVACRIARARPLRIATGALALSGWDLFLDPQMVTEGYWSWPGGGPYRGVPLSNYLGWLVAASVLMAVLSAVLPGLDDRPVAVLYAVMSVMEVVGFAVFFGDPLVAVVGGAVCLPLAAAALVGGPVWSGAPRGATT